VEKYCLGKHFLFYQVEENVSEKKTFLYFTKQQKIELENHLSWENILDGKSFFAIKYTVYIGKFLRMTAATTLDSAKF